MKFSKHAKILAIILIAAILISIPISAFFGSADVSISDVFDVIKYKLLIPPLCPRAGHLVLGRDGLLPSGNLTGSPRCGAGRFSHLLLQSTLHLFLLRSAAGGNTAPELGAGGLHRPLHHIHQIGRAHV